LDVGDTPVRVRSGFVRVCLAAMLALLPAAQQARAQDERGGGVPQEWHRP